MGDYLENITFWIISIVFFLNIFLILMNSNLHGRLNPAIEAVLSFFYLVLIGLMGWLVDIKAAFIIFFLGFLFAGLTLNLAHKVARIILNKIYKSLK